MPAYTGSAVGHSERPLASLQDAAPWVRIPVVLLRSTTGLSALSGKPIRFRFYLTNEQLFTFLVTPDPNDASNGHVATDGEGFVRSEVLSKDQANFRSA